MAISERATRLRSRTMSTAALRLLTAEAKGEPPPGGAATVWPELVAAGIAGAPGAVRASWAQLLREASRGDIALEIVSRAGRAGMRSTVTLTPGAGLGITERRRLQVTEREVVVEAVEDAVELSVFDPTLVWPAVRRLLPPSEAVRAEGGRSTALDEQRVAVVGEVPERSVLPDDVLGRLASAQVEVSLTMHVSRGDGVPPAVTQRHWAQADDGGLLEVRVVGGAVEVVDVPAGTIADEVVWLAAGAMDIRARALGVAS